MFSRLVYDVVFYFVVGFLYLCVVFSGLDIGVLSFSIILFGNCMKICVVGWVGCFLIWCGILFLCMVVSILVVFFLVWNVICENISFGVLFFCVMRWISVLLFWYSYVLGNGNVGCGFGFQLSILVKNFRMGIFFVM